jgi:hypothetical protein
MVLSLLMIILASLGCSFRKIKVNSRGANFFLEVHKMNLMSK